MLFRQNNIKSFRHENSAKRRKVVFLVLLVVLVTIVSIGPFRRGVTSGLMFVGKPLWIVRESFAQRAPYAATYFTSKKKLERENNELREELDRLDHILIENASLQDDIDDLMDMLSLRPENQDRATSIVLQRPSLGAFDTMIISSGRDEGIGVGDVVYSQGKVAIGKVLEVYQSTSKVVLFSSGNIETKVLVGEDKISLVSKGEGGGNFSIEFPADIDIESGDIVYLEDEVGSIIAVIEEVLSTPGGLISEAIGRSPTNINSIKYVEVSKSITQ